MSRVIRISQSNWERLKRFAIPLEDSIDEALGKVLTMAESLKEQEWDLNGAGNLSQSAQETTVTEKPLLVEFERWLQQENKLNAIMLHRKKTMATWELRTRSGKTFKVLVPTDRGNMLCIPKGDYSPIDATGKVVQKGCYNQNTGKSVGWYHYALFSIKKPDDLVMAKDLVKFIIERF